MAKGNEVLEMLIPTGGWVIVGDDFESIRYDEGITPISKKAFEEGFAKVDEWKASEKAKEEEAKAALFTRLGITQEELRLLLA